jgi:hypothetical protein
MGAGEEEAQQGGNRHKPVLHIPSHAQVLENSRPQPPPSFFRPSSQAAGGASGTSEQQGRGGGAPSSFTEAFSFVRQTEFYTPPPAAPPPAAPAPSSSEGDHGGGVGSRPQEYVFLRVFLSCFCKHFILLTRVHQSVVPCNLLITAGAD